MISELLLPQDKKIGCSSRLARAMLRGWASLGDEGDPSASHLALTGEKEKVQRALPQVRSHFRPAVMDSVMPPQDLVAALYRRSISLSPFPREQEFPTAGSCQLARPSCASGKVNWALCPLQDESRTIVLRDVNQGCAYLLGFAGLMVWGMCSPQWLLPAPRAEDMGCVRGLPSLYWAGTYMLRDRCINR